MTRKTHTLELTVSDEWGEIGALVRRSDSHTGRRSGVNVRWSARDARGRSVKATHCHLTGEKLDAPETQWGQREPALDALLAGVDYEPQSLTIEKAGER
jgi:hypothetical protein